jgi:pilus assembly protein CpaE
MKITVLSNNPPSFQSLKTLLEEHCKSDQLVLLDRATAKINIEMDEVATAALLILDYADVEQLDWTAIEEFNLRNPQSTTLLVCRGDLESILMHAMRVGVRDVLNSPVDKDQFLQVVQRARVRLLMASGGRATGKVFTFIPCKGGSGTSFICSNLGFVLSELHKKRVLLIDLDLHFGDASFYITDDDSGRSLADIVRQNALDGAMIETASVQIGSHFWLLRAPQNPEQAIGITPDQIDNLITVAARNYDFVFVDLERALDPLSLRALDRADTIFPFMQTMLPYVRGTQKLQRTFRALHYPESKIKLIANRYDKSSDLSLSKIEDALKTKFYKVLPNDFPNATASMNAGKPIYQVSPSGSLTTAIMELANELVGQVGIAPAQPSLWHRVSSLFE